MKTTIKKKNDYLIELTIKLTWDEIKPDYDKTFNKVKSNHTPQGGRKGKLYGPQLKQFIINKTPLINTEFIDHYINEYFRKALDESKLHPINQGQITKVDFNGENTDLSFTIVFEVTPEIKLPNYTKKIKVSTNKYIADDKDVNQSIEDLRNQNAKAMSVERPLKSGDFIYADFYKTDENGVPLKEGKLPNHYIKIGEGLFSDKLEKPFLNKKVGDQIEVSIPQESGEIKYSVKINKIEEQVLPEINDELASLVDKNISTLKDLKEKLKENIQINLDNENKKEYNEKIIDFFSDKTKFEPPISMVENYKKILIEDYKTKNPNSLDEEKMSKEFEDVSSKNVKWYMIKNILLKQENINVSDKDINEKIEEFEKQNPTQINKIKKFYKDEKNQSKLKEDLINYKLFNILEKYFINKVKEISTDKIRNKKG